MWEPTKECRGGKREPRRRVKHGSFRWISRGSLLLSLSLSFSPHYRPLPIKGRRWLVGRGARAPSNLRLAPTSSLALLDSSASASSSSLLLLLLLMLYERRCCMLDRWSFSEKIDLEFFGVLDRWVWEGWLCGIISFG